MFIEVFTLRNYESELTAGPALPSAPGLPGLPVTPYGEKATYDV